MKNTLFVLSTFLLMSTAHAQINFNQVTYRGTGCPQGTVSTAVSPDGASLSILFDEFRAEVPQYDGNNDNETAGGRGRTRNTPTLNHKNCALSFTATLPAGMKAEELEVSLQARGAAILDQGLEALFASILVGYDGLATSRGRPTIIASKHYRSLRGTVDDEFVASPSIKIPLNSNCAASQARSIRFDLKNHVQAEITSGDTSKHGIITLDSADMKGMLKFTLRTRTCVGGRMPPR